MNLYTARSNVLPNLRIFLKIYYRSKLDFLGGFICKMSHSNYLAQSIHINLLNPKVYIIYKQVNWLVSLQWQLLRLMSYGLQLKRDFLPLIFPLTFSLIFLIRSSLAFVTCNMFFSQLFCNFLLLNMKFWTLFQKDMLWLFFQIWNHYLYIKPISNDSKIVAECFLNFIYCIPSGQGIVISGVTQKCFFWKEK